MSNGDSIDEGIDLVKTAQNNIITVYVNKFDEESFKDFRQSFLRAETTGQTIIPVVIDSAGGNVYALFGMIDLIRASKHPVATVAIGKAMSCGCDLLAAGTPGYRWASPLASIMVHQGYTLIEGKVSDLVSDAEEDKRVNDKGFDLLDKHCKKTSGYWKNILKEQMNTNIWLTAEQAYDHGIIDHIGVPRIEAEITVETKLT